MRHFENSKIVAAFALATTLAIPTMLPTDALAQGRYDHAGHRQDTKNTWRNLGVAGGVLGVAGLLTGNKTLAVLGIGGGLYSASRYEADRKSQNRDEHRRYELFSHKSFDYQGHRYERHTKTVKGQRQYYFQRMR